jgi:hypothetical protein
MISPAASRLFRPEALDNYRSGRPMPTVDGGRGRAPRWPMRLLAILVLVGLGFVGTVRIPTFADGSGVASGDTQIRAVFPGTPDPPVRADQPATLAFAGRTAKARVVAVEPVPDRAAATAQGLPASVPLPVVMVSLRAERGASVRGWSGQVTVETSRATILGTMLDGIG